MDPIIEVPVYDGSLKVWRLLNLNTGTVYSTQHETMEEALAESRREPVRIGRAVCQMTVDVIYGWVGVCAGRTPTGV